MAMLAEVVEDIHVRIHASSAINGVMRPPARSRLNHASFGDLEPPITKLRLNEPRP